MRIKVFLYAVLLSFFWAAQLFSRFAIDEIRIILYLGSGDEVILTSDIKPRLDGVPQTLRDLILEVLMLEDARRLKLSVSEEDVERFFVELQKKNRISRETLKAAMLQEGYDFEEGKEKIRKNQLVSQIISILVKSDKRLIIQKEEVEKYYSKYPEEISTNFTLSQVVLPGESDLKKKFSKEYLDTLEWEKPFTIVEDELAPEMKFIVDEKIGSIVDMELVEGGMEITRLVGKTERMRVPMEDRYDEIVMILSEKIFNELRTEYENKLLEENRERIRFTYPEDEIAVMGNRKSENKFLIATN